MRKYIAVDIGGTSIKYGIVQADGIILEKYKCPTGKNNNGDYLLEKIIDLIEELIDDIGCIHGIGISSAGQIDYKTGEVVFATENLTGWTGMKIKESIYNRFQLPVYVDNDVNCAALAEKWLGVARDVSNFLCLTVGTGIGGAIFINNQIYRGQMGIAAEWGHMVIKKNGLICNCGQQGCFESYASTKSLIKYVKDKMDNDYTRVDGKFVFQQAEAGNDICQKAIDRFVDYLGQGIANLVHIFNPSLVVVGGAVVAQGKPLLKKIRERTNNYIMASFMKKLKIELSCNGEYAGMLGAIYGLKCMEEIKCIK